MSSELKERASLSRSLVLSFSHSLILSFSSRSLSTTCICVGTLVERESSLNGEINTKVTERDGSQQNG